MLTAPRCPCMAAGGVSQIKSHVIIILSFCNIVKGQANYRLINALLKIQLVRGYFEIFGHPGPDNQGHAVIAVS